MTVQEFHNIFGKNIKKYRILSGLSQEKLAEMMDLSTNTICEIETGKKFVRAETLIRFSTVFNTYVYEFFKPESILPDNLEIFLNTYDEKIKKSMDEIKKDLLDRI